MPSKDDDREAARGEIEARLKAYYEQMYRSEVGLKDWKQRVNNRINEEALYCSRYIDFLLDLFPDSIRDKDVLVVGAGTGGEIVNFANLGARVTAVEPNEEALEICRLKRDYYDLEGVDISKHSLSEKCFDSDSFDLVYCQTVIEHVKDVEETLRQMIRVTRPQGLVFIGAPDYRQFWEPHYKLPLPMMLPRLFIQLMLRALGRPTLFLKSLSLVTSRQFTNFFMENKVTAMRVIVPWPERWKKNPLWYEKAIMVLTKSLEIHRDQIWILKKTGER
jgi:2-polyprenyl-3-methyl-5-hydroxy-6-metoxy-1,4-benzoquinol methylase